MDPGRSGERKRDTDGGRELRPDTRPFQSWSEDSLESELDRTAAWLRARLVTFASKWDLPPIHPDRVPDFSELQTIIRVVRRETRRLEVLAGELRLRRHWSASDQPRTLVEEEWRVHRTGDVARVRRTE